MCNRADDLKVFQCGFRLDISGMLNWRPAGRMRHTQAMPIPAPQRQKTLRYVMICHVTRLTDTHEIYNQNDITIVTIVDILSWELIEGVRPSSSYLLSAAVDMPDSGILKYFEKRASVL